MGTSSEVEKLRKIALRYPETDEGIACAGTALETRTVRARGKAFLFLRGAEVRLKLGASLPDARKLAAAAPECCEAGASGWIKLTLGNGAPTPDALARWVDESYRLLAPKSLVAVLPKASASARRSKRR